MYGDAVQSGKAGRITTLDSTLNIAPSLAVRGAAGSRCCYDAGLADREIDADGGLGIAHNAPAPRGDRWASASHSQSSAAAGGALDAHPRFARGAVGHWGNDHAGHGLGQGARYVHDATGSPECPSDRTGREVQLHRDIDQQLGLLNP